MAWGFAQAGHHAKGHEGGKVNPKETIFEHLGDTYGWEVPFSHTMKIPLPISVFDNAGKFHCLMSSRVTPFSRVEHHLRYQPMKKEDIKESWYKCLMAARSIAHGISQSQKTLLVFSLPQHWLFSWQ